MSSTVTFDVHEDALPLTSVTVNVTLSFVPTSAQVKSVRDKVIFAIPQASLLPLSISAGVIDAFPDAYYLHLSLHPRLSCETIYQTRKAAAETHLGRQIGAETTIDPEAMWLQPHVQILGAMETVPDDRKLFMRGEDLLSDPEPALIKIAEWLGIRTDKEAIDAMMRPEESPFSSYGPENAPLGNDPHFLENPEFVPYVNQDLDLDSPMSWDETLVFDETVKELARYFGY